GVGEQGEHLGVEERLASREVDLLHAELFRLADGAAGDLGADRLQPRLAGRARIEAVEPLEVAPGAPDLDPQGREAEEGCPRRVCGRGHPVDHGQTHRSSHVSFFRCLCRLFRYARCQADQTKMLSGMNAETIQLGASTISLILRSAATLQMM